jgi:hypothetical protein
MEERRSSRYTEKISTFMVIVASLGAYIVLVDPKITITFLGQSLVINGGDFSADLKGAVISAILIGGWTAVKEFWLGASAGQMKQSETIARIATAPLESLTPKGPTP